nr:MAG TPA: rubredoxin-like iron binding domain containing a [Caudoviricetes sp.]
MRLIDGDALIEKFNEKTDLAECLVDARAAKRFATFCALADAVEEMPTVDAEVVVRCKDCEYSYDEISYLCCSHGVCVDCEVPPNFYCAYGKRRAEKEPPEEGET